MPESRKTIEQRYEQFKRENPHILPLFIKFALQAWNAGRRRYGVKAIAERVRWHVNVEVGGGEEFKLCNDYTSRIARDLIADPDHGLKFAQMFTIRTLRAE